jgi:MSHA biogenesis protein MshN
VSLINKMLRDLDERQASALERGGLATQVRALPREKRFPWVSVLPILVGSAIGVTGIWLALDASQPATPAPSEAAVPIPIGPAAPTVAMALPALVVPMPAEQPERGAEASAAAQRGSPVAGSLQLDTRLSQVPPHSAPAPTAPMPAAQIDKRPLVQAAESADGEYRKAMSAYRQGRISEAIDGFHSALRIDPRNVTARQSLLSLLLDQQRWQDAQKAATEGLVLLPAQAGWAMILARLQVEQGQVADAEQTMAAHGQYGERSADFLAFHGLLLEKLQRPQEARTAFMKARELGNLPPDLAAAIEQRLR